MAGDSISGLFKDKKVQIGAAVVGGVGLLVLVMRKGGSSSSSPQTMIQPAAGVNSSGADLYNALQGLGQGWQNDLQGFTAQLSNVNDKLSKLPTGGTGNPPANGGGQPAPAPNPTHTTLVKEGTLLGWFLSPTFDLTQFKKLNPSASIAGSNANGYTKDGSGNPTLSANQWITLPGSA